MERVAIPVLLLGSSYGEFCLYLQGYYKPTGVRRWCSWLTHCAISRKVAVRIPDGVIGVLRYPNYANHTMTLGSTRPLTETSTSDIFW